MNTDPRTLFPPNPTHGSIFELTDGLIYQYDATQNCWIQVSASSISLPLATTTVDGAMSASDLRKLNRLVLPPPISSLVGANCVAPFRHGTITLESGDKYIDIAGNLSVQNIDAQGQHLAKDIPYHIHQHTYGFDFTFDLPAFVAELKRRKQINVVGKTGPTGEKGDTGEPGLDMILSGPQGEPGNQGTVPQCSLAIESEVVSAQVATGHNKAITGVSLDSLDATKYKLVFTRQAVGKPNGAASTFNVKQSTSSWVLAVALAGNDQVQNTTCPVTNPAAFHPNILYLDVDGIIDSIHLKFLREVDRLKKGYEDIVAYWIQTMSDLFDEQKAALCCALEFCLSATKSISLRQHIETVAAQATAGNAKIVLHTRDSNEAIEISSTQLLGQVNKPDHIDGGGQDVCFPIMAGQRAVASEQIEQTITIDPLLNSSITTAAHSELPAGEYVAVITALTAQIDGLHYGNVRLRSLVGGTQKIVEFLNKGKFASLVDAQATYVGLVLPFDHDGGEIALWLPSINPKTVSGQIVITIRSRSQMRSTKPLEEPVAQAVLGPTQCEMSLSHLAWYKRGWETGKCCGAVLNLAGQDYIVFKRSLGNDLGCGGGESLLTPCIAKFVDAEHNYPAFAWPSLDGKDFAPLPTRDSIIFQHDTHLNELAAQQLAAGQATQLKGEPNGIRHVAFQLSTILFPLA